MRTRSVAAERPARKPAHRGPVRNRPRSRRSAERAAGSTHRLKIQFSGTSGWAFGKKFLRDETKITAQKYLVVCVYNGNALLNIEVGVL